MLMDVKLNAALSLVSKLASPLLDLQRKGVCELRLLAKVDMDSRAAIAQAGAVPLLLRLLSSSDSKIQENAVTTLLNLSICPSNRDIIMRFPTSLDSILGALTSGKTMETKENTAALLFSLMVEADYRPAIGQKPGFIQALLDLVRSGSWRCMKDALKALFHLSLCPENRPNVVAAGGIPVFFSLLLNGKSGLVEDSLAVIAQTLGCPESVEPCRKLSAIPILVDLLDTGSQRAQENAASALLNHCMSGGEEVVREVLEISSSLSFVSTLLSTGSNRAKTKASALLQLLVVG